MRLRFFSLSATAALLVAIASPAAFAQTATPRSSLPPGQNPSNTLNARNCLPNQNNQSLLNQSSNSSLRISPSPSGTQAGQRFHHPLAVNGQNLSPRRQNLSNNSSNTQNSPATQTTQPTTTTLTPTMTTSTTTTPTTTTSTTTTPTTVTQPTVTTNNQAL